MMSFSKAKLKRFNEATDSPYADRMERKDSIKKLIKELSKDAEIKRTQSKESAAAAAATVAAASSDAESAKVTSEKSRHPALRLFRTPSLPRRLRFNRQHSDLTPKEKSSAAKALFNNTDQDRKEKEALEAANVEIKNKTEVLLEYEQIIEELRLKSHKLTTSNNQNVELIKLKDRQILDLEKEIEGEQNANEVLKSITEQSIGKIEILEGEIKTILRTHDNEIDFIIASNTELEIKCERLLTETEKQREQIAFLHAEMQNSQDENDFLKLNLQKELEKLNELSIDCNQFVEENLRLFNEAETLKKQADEDMLAYVEESQKMIHELDIMKMERTKLLEDISLKAEMIAGLEQELSGKDIDMDSIHDEIRESFQAEIKCITKKYEQQICTMKELNEMKVKEIESISVLERSKLTKDHSDLVKQIKSDHQKGIERINETNEEKIRISEIQTEQKFKALESTLEQAIDQERVMWKNEIDKCQKIAETEIMQCEFEKQDLKTLLESANELMREKDEQIEELQKKLNTEIGSYVRTREDYDAEINEARMECARIMTEKYNYQLTLKNTRSTVNILMERLKKSDTDVEILKAELEQLNECKMEVENKNQLLSEELLVLRKEIDDYRGALNALRHSSLALEREVKERESVFEKLMSSEEETLETVNKIGKLFNDKLEENIGIYFDLYTDVKRKYDARENYIRDMKALLDEFANGIELARIELDTKDKKLFELQHENKSIKLENMTYKFRCEQFEKYDNEQRLSNPLPNFPHTLDKLSADEQADALVSESLIANIINQLEKEASHHGDVAAVDVIRPPQTKNIELYCDEDKINAENSLLKEKLTEKSKQIEFLQEMVKLENEHVTENLELKQKLEDIQEKMKSVEKFAKETADKYAELSSAATTAKTHTKRKQMDHLKDSNVQLKNKITQLQQINKEQESKIMELNEKVHHFGTPRKQLNVSLNSNVVGTTPKTPVKLYPGKENQSPIVTSSIVAPVGHHSPALRTRKN